MIFGTTTFKCDKCGNCFTGIAMEWHACAFLVPQKCTKCGSRHTYPNDLHGFFSLPIYRKIWAEIDKDMSTNK